MKVCPASEVSALLCLLSQKLIREIGNILERYILKDIIICIAEHYSEFQKSLGILLPHFLQLNRMFYISDIE